MTACVENGAAATPYELVRQRAEEMDIAEPERDWGFRFRCPVPSHGKGQGDRNSSAQAYRKKSGGATLLCHAGCASEDVATAMGFTLGDLEPKPKVEGCTLELYAEAKQLPVEFLKTLGLTTTRYGDGPAVKIVHYDESGTERSILYRLRAEPRLLRWKKCSKAMPYGLERLRDARAANRITVVEGPSDVHTLWYHGEPALGLAGAGGWSREVEAALQGVGTIYVVVEPGEAGANLLKAVSGSPLRDRVRPLRLEVKDPSALHCKDPAAFPAAWRAAMDAAPRLVDELDRERAERIEQATARSADLLQETNLLQVFQEDLGRAGVVGEERVGKLILLVFTSRLLPRPVSAVVKGPSSAGKSYVPLTAIRFLPDDEYYSFTGMSERALVFDDRPLSHKTIVLYEAAGMGSEVLQYILRSLLSEGAIRYGITERDTQGEYRMREIHRPGPTNLILSTTATRIHAENETRLVSVTVDDSRAQTARILEKTAESDEREDDVDVGRWHALQDLLRESQLSVSVPFARVLSRLIDPVAVRLRRDFPNVLSLTKAHALLHFRHRARDVRGRVVATVEDYSAVRELVEDLVAQSAGAAISARIRETVAAVKEIQGEGGTSVSKVAERLDLDRSAAHRRVKQALEDGYLVNEGEKDDRGRAKSVMVLKVGADLPGDKHVLPTREQLEAKLEEEVEEPEPEEALPIPEMEPDAPPDAPQPNGWCRRPPCPSCGHGESWGRLDGGRQCCQCRVVVDRKGVVVDAC